MENLKVPFTPFHMGAALLVKPVLGRRLSVISFGVAQVLMDIEPGIGMLRDADVLHGYSHTLPGALLISLLSAWLSSWLAGGILRRWNREFQPLGLRWLQVPAGLPASALLIGALFGTFSHLVLDGLIHHDIRPLWPLTSSNPFAHWVEHDAVYLGCAMAGALGGLVWLLAQWRNRNRNPV